MEKTPKQPPILFKETQETINKIEELLNSPLITYYNSNAGNVCENDVIAFYRLLKGKKFKKLYFYIKSDGGSGIAALKLVSILRNHCDELIALIPSNCASAATMMALGANKIIMSPLGYLTSVDTSLSHELSPRTRTNDLVSVSMNELDRVVKLWKDNEKQNDENSERQEQRYGKFKNPEELLHAYQELEKEFTRRSQKLRELENANSEPFASEEEWRAAVDKFFEETPSAKPFARDIANEILSHPELKKDRNCLSVALTRTLANKFRTPEQLMSDGQFLKDYVLCSKEVKDAVIAEYLQGIRANEVPFVLSSGGMQCVTNPKGPRTIEEAGFMFLKDNQ